MSSAPAQNRFSSRKLLLSKWTAQQPQSRERHFLVVKVPEADAPPSEAGWVEIEAVLTRRRQRIPEDSLRNLTHWQMGWK